MAQSSMESESEDSDSLMPQPVKKMRHASLRFGLSQPYISMIAMLVEVGPLMWNLVIQRLNLMKLSMKVLREPILITGKRR